MKDSFVGRIELREIRGGDPGAKNSGFRGACHRARIRATRWLAMTVSHVPQDVDGRDKPGHDAQIRKKSARLQPGKSRLHGIDAAVEFAQIGQAADGETVRVLFAGLEQF
jgi:hypothetical protein